MEVNLKEKIQNGINSNICALTVVNEGDWYQTETALT